MILSSPKPGAGHGARRVFTGDATAGFVKVKGAELALTHRPVASEAVIVAVWEPTARAGVTVARSRLQPAVVPDAVTVIGASASMVTAHVAVPAATSATRCGAASAFADRKSIASNRVFMLSPIRVLVRWLELRRLDLPAARWAAGIAR